MKIKFINFNPCGIMMQESNEKFGRIVLFKFSIDRHNGDYINDIS